MRRRLLGAAIAAGLIVSPGAALADTAVVQDSSISGITALRGRLVWVHKAADGREALAQMVGGQISELPIAPQPDFNAVDLGTDADGRPVLTYARCKLEARACDLFAYDFAANREHRIGGGVSKPGCNESAGAYSHGRLVFARWHSARCSGGAFLKRPGHKPERIGRRTPVSVDHAVGVAALQYRYEDDTGDPITSVNLVRPGKPGATVVDEGISDLKNTDSVYSAVLDGGHVYWVSYVSEEVSTPDVAGSSSYDVLRRSTKARSRRHAAKRSFDAVEEIAVGRGSLYYRSESGIFLADDPLPRF